jgi:hypothetical protein
MSRGVRKRLRRAVKAEVAQASDPEARAAWEALLDVVELQPVGKLELGDDWEGSVPPEPGRLTAAERVAVAITHFKVLP